MQISEKIKNIRVSGTIKMADLARELQQEGNDIIELSEGEPDFDTPGFVIESSFQAAQNGQTRYTAVSGTLELREAIAKKFLKNKIKYAVDEIIVGSGAKQLIFNALFSTINPGDEVIIPAPYWVSYPDIVKLSDGVPVFIECKEGNDFKITDEQLRESLTSKSRWLILNSPGNPTGAVYSSDELLALAEIIRLFPNLSVICDDIYESITFDNHNFVTLVEVAPDLKERVLTVNGVSKSYAMTGWRIGYAGGPLDLIDAMKKLQGQSTTNASSIGQAAALAALNGSQEILTDWNVAYRRRMNIVFDELSKVEGLVLRKPQGAFYHFVNCSKLLGKTTPLGVVLKTDIDICTYFIQEALVALVPGSEFGCPGYFRLCFAKSDQQLKAACSNLVSAINNLL